LGDGRLGAKDAFPSVFLVPTGNSAPHVCHDTLDFTNLVDRIIKAYLTFLPVLFQSCNCLSYVWDENGDNAPLTFSWVVPYKPMAFPS